MRDKIFGYHQSALIEHDINLKEALLLNYLKNFLKNEKASKVSHNGRDYHLIYYKKILSDLPILDISYNRLREIVRCLENKGFIEKYKADINSSMLYLRICDRPLTYTRESKVYDGRDTLLTNFVKANWGIIKYAKPKIVILADAENNESYKYTNALINMKIVLNNYDTFELLIKSNLKSYFSTSVYNSINNILFINNEIVLYTKNSGTLQPIFEDNLYKFEQCICLSYIELIKSL